MSRDCGILVFPSVWWLEVQDHYINTVLGGVSLYIVYVRDHRKEDNVSPEIREYPDLTPRHDIGGFKVTHILYLELIIVQEVIKGSAEKL